MICQFRLYFESVMRFSTVLFLGLLASTSHAMLPTSIATPLIANPTAIAPTPIAVPVASLTAQPIAIKQDFNSKIFAYLVQTSPQPATAKPTTQISIASETLTPITPATPIAKGSVIEYQVFFDNVGGQRIRSANLTLDIPAGLELVSVSGDNVFASVDGKQFARMPLRTQMNGQITELPLFYYRNLRWQVADVGLGGTAVVKYRAKVL